MKTHELIKDLSESGWFKEPSEFRCCVQKGHEKLCVITGPNASGKSVLRKVICGSCDKRKVKTMYFSQSARCAGGITRAFIYNDETENSTGSISSGTFLKAIKNGKSWEKPFVIIFDEPEIGCGEELQAAMAVRLAKELDALSADCLGIFVITHSREFARHLLPLNPTHWRLDVDNLTLEQWVNRKIVPIESLEDLDAINWRRYKIVDSLMEKKRHAN